MGPTPQHGFVHFLEELKRRRIVRAALVYGAVAWAVVEAADVFVPALRLPDAIVTAVAVVVLLGFPLAMAVAWVFDVTPEGVRRTSSSPDAARSHSATSGRWVGGRTLLVVVVALATGGAFGWFARAGEAGEAGGSGSADRSSIAVLPFVDLGPTGSDQYLGDGVAEELLNVLAQVPGLRVAARTSAFSFRGADVDLREIGDRLGVATVMEGSVRRDGDRVRITAQLIDARTGYHLFSEDFDREMRGLVEVQEELALSIARALRLPLRIGLDDSGAARRTADAEAYDHYLRGLTFLHQREVRRATASFRRALDRDSTFAAAWAQLAQAEALRPYFLAGTWEEALPAAERAARRALGLDSASAAAFTALANIHRDRWEWRAAEATYRRALDVAPDDIEAIEQYGQHLIQIGRFEDAIHYLERAQELDPLAWVHPATLGWAHLLAGHYDDAERALRRSITIWPGSTLSRHGLLFLLLSTGREAEIERESRLFDGLDAYDAWVARQQGGGEVDPIRARYREARGYATTVAPLLALIAGGHREAFLELLDDWSRDGVGNIHLLWLPQLEPWREDPRFRRSVERTGVPDPPA